MDKKYLVTVLGHYVCMWVIVKAFIYISPHCVGDFINYGFALLLTYFIGSYTFNFTKEKLLPKCVESDGKAVFITGCDRGFGKALAIRLDSMGFHVFASCLSESGPDAVDLKNQSSDRLRILELDVTKDQSVQAAVEFVKENLGTSELWAIVNNAGIHKGFSVELTDMQDFKDCIDVNTYGPVRVTKAFLPLLRQSRGRVVNITSLIGKMVLPYFTPYTMSKYAAVGFADSLRQELDVWGVSVITIEPEIFQTGLTEKKEVEKRLQASLDKLDASVRADYGEKYLKYFQKIARIFIDLASPRTEVVVNDLVSAISSHYPDSVYRPRRNALFRLFLYIYQMSPIPVQDTIVKYGILALTFENCKPAAKLCKSR